MEELPGRKIAAWCMRPSIVFQWPDMFGSCPSMGALSPLGKVAALLKNPAWSYLKLEKI